MITIRLVSAFGLLLVASTAAQAGTPVAATPAAAGQLAKLDLGLSEADYVLDAGQARVAPRLVDAEGRKPAHGSSLAHYLQAPAPYGGLLPQPIEDRGVGYRLWF
jgi:hypothetical protein